MQLSLGQGLKIILNYPAGLRSKDKSPYKRKAGVDLGGRRRGHVKREAETGGTQPQAKDPWSHQRLEEEGKMPPWSLRMERGSTGMLILMAAFQSCEKINCCCFRPRSLKYVLLLQPQDTNAPPRLSHVRGQEWLDGWPCNGTEKPPSSGQHRERGAHEEKAGWCWAGETRGGEDPFEGEPEG